MASAVAIADYIGEDEDDLVFYEGDLVTDIEDTENEAWKVGICHGREGLFPANFVDFDFAEEEVVYDDEGEDGEYSYEYDDDEVADDYAFDGGATDDPVADEPYYDDNPSDDWDEPEPEPALAPRPAANTKPTAAATSRPPKANNTTASAGGAGGQKAGGQTLEERVGVVRRPLEIKGRRPPTRRKRTNQGSERVQAVLAGTGSPRGSSAGASGGGSAGNRDSGSTAGSGGSGSRIKGLLGRSKTTKAKRPANKPPAASPRERFDSIASDFSDSSRVSDYGNSRAAPPAADPVPARDPNTFYDGFLYKLGGLRNTKWQRRFFKMVAGKIMYYADVSDKVPKGAIPLYCTTQVVPESGLSRPNAFKVMNKGKIVTLSAETPGEVDLWMSEISKLTIDYLAEPATEKELANKKLDAPFDSTKPVARSGAGWKLGGFKKSKWKRHWLVLNADGFYWFSDSKDMVPKGGLGVGAAVIKYLEGASRESCFTIVNGEREVSFSANSDDDRDQWRDELESLGARFEEQVIPEPEPVPAAAAAGGNGGGFLKLKNRKQNEVANSNKYDMQLSAIAIELCVADRDDEISFNVGDRITNIRPTENADWCKGDCNGRRGFFPKAFVEFEGGIDPEKNVGTLSGAPPVKKKVVAPPQSTAAARAPQGMSAVAIEDCEADRDDEISFVAGDVITNIRDTENADWCKGDCNGRRGFFPRAFVQFTNTKQAMRNSAMGGGGGGGGGAAAKAKVKQPPKPMPKPHLQQWVVDIQGVVGKTDGSGLRKKVKDVYAAVCGHTLFMYKTKSDTAPLEEVCLEDYDVYRDQKKDRTINVSVPGGTAISITLADEGDYTAWLRALRRAVTADPPRKAGPVAGGVRIGGGPGGGGSRPPVAAKRRPGGAGSGSGTGGSGGGNPYGGYRKPVKPFGAKMVMGFGKISPTKLRPTPKKTRPKPGGGTKRRPTQKKRPKPKGKGGPPKRGKSRGKPKLKPKKSNKAKVLRKRAPTRKAPARPTTKPT